MKNLIKKTISIFLTLTLSTTFMLPSYAINSDFYEGSFFGASASILDLTIDTHVILSENTTVDNLYINRGFLDLNGYTLTVTGNVTIDGGTLTIGDDGLLIVRGNIATTVSNPGNSGGGIIAIDGGSMLIDGNLNIEGAGRWGSSKLIMTEATDYVLVGGDFTIISWHDDETFTNGILEIKGNFTQIDEGSNNFYATDNHKVILSGDRQQTVNFESFNSKFATLELRNSSDAGVFITAFLNADTLIQNDSKMTFKYESIQGWTLTQDTIHNGDFMLRSGTLDLNGYTLTINGNLIQPIGTISINGGELIVTGDYLIQTPAEGMGIGSLIMTNSDDLVRISGSFITCSNVSHDGLLTAGIMEIGGDFKQYGWDNFYASGMHKVVLNGTGLQTVYFDNMWARNSWFNGLEITNTSSAGVYLSSNVFISGELFPTQSVVTNSSNLHLTETAVLTDNTWKHDLTIVGDRTLSGDIEIGGSLFIEGGTFEFNGYNLNIGGSLYNRGTIILDGDLSIGESFNQRGSNFDLNGRTLIIPDNVIINGGSLTVGNDGLLNVAGDVVIEGGTLNIGGGNLLIDGDLAVQSSGILNMTNADDYILVNGDFATQAWNSHSGRLTNGVLEIKGDFTQSGGLNNFLATGNHRVILSGSDLQTVNFESITSRFATLELQNFSDAGIYVSTFLNADTLIQNGSKVTFKDENILGWALDEDTVHNGNLLLTGGLLDLNGYTLTINGNLIQPGGTVYINGGTLEVIGNYLIQTPAGGSSTGELIMNNAIDIVRINGNFTTHSTVSHSGLLTAGIMEIGGNFTQSSNNQTNFQTSGTHRVILNGTESQIVHFASSWGSNSGFNRLEITNTSSEGVNFSSRVFVTDQLFSSDSVITNSSNLNLAETATLVNNRWNHDLRIADNHTLPANTIIGGSLFIDRGIFNFNGHNLNVGGSLVSSGTVTLDGNLTIGDSLTISGGTFNLNGHALNIPGDVIVSGTGSNTILNIGGGRLLVDGDLRIQNQNANETFSSSSGILNMTNVNDYILVNGDFVTQSSSIHSGRLTNGVLEVKGDFTQINGNSRTDNFLATSNHRVILSGDNMQTVNFASSDSRFAILELRNLSSEGVHFTSSLNAITVIQNDSRIVFNDGGVLGWALEQNAVHNGDLLIAAGTLNLNGYTLTVNGNLIQSGGMVQISGGELVVTGDYLIQTSAGGASTGRLNMTNVNDIVRINGNFSSRSAVSHNGFLTAGTMEIAGNIINATNFQATGTHRVILNGTESQTISGTAFSILEIKNTSTAGVNFTSISSVSNQLLPTNSVLINSSNIRLSTTAVIIGNVWKDDLRIVGNNTLSGDIEIGGSLFIESGILDFNGHSIAIGGSLTSSATITYNDNLIIGDSLSITGGTFNMGGGELNIPGNLINSGTFNFNGGDLIINESLMVNGGTFNLNGNELTIPGNVIISNGALNIGGGSLLIDGNLTVQSGQLGMTNANDYVLVNGNFLTQSSSAHNGRLTNGILEIKGNFTQINGRDDNFFATGNHRVILSGDKLQTVDFESITSKFATLEFLNLSDAGVRFVITLNADTLIQNGSKITFDDGSVLGWTLTQDMVHNGNLLLAGGILNLNGHTLTIDGNLIQPSGTVFVNNGTLEITGDYLLQPSVSGTNIGRLNMTNSDDLVSIGGNFVTRSTIPHSGLLTAGVMEVGENFNQFNNNANNFQTSGTHKVILNGTGFQTINFNNPSAANSRFNALEITNTSDAGVNFSSSIFVIGQLYPTNSVITNSSDIRLAGTAVLVNNTWNHDLRIVDNRTLSGDTVIGGSLFFNSGTFNLNGYTLTVTGDVIVNGGRLDIGGGELLIDGDLSIQSNLNMTSANDYVLVNGNFSINTRGSGQLTNGILEVKGNFTQTGDNFFAIGNHRVILSGNGLQTITFEGTSSKFATLELQNFSDAGLHFTMFFNADTLIQNSCRITFSDGNILGFALEQDIIFNGDLMLIGGTLDLNGYKLTVNGDFVHPVGTVNINGGELVVTGDYLIQSPTNSSSAGRLIMTNADDLVRIGGNFVTRSTVSHSGLLSAGIMEIGGDFNQLVSNLNNFQTSGTHKVVFNGTGLQTINFANPSAINSRFSGLEIKNTSSAGVNFSSNAFVINMLFSTESVVTNSSNICLTGAAVLTDNSWKHDLRIIDNRTLSGDTVIGGSLLIDSQTLNLNRHTLTVHGNVIISGGTLDINNGSLLVGGNLRLQTQNANGTFSASNGSLRMTNENDYIRINGSFITQSNSSHNHLLTNGILEVRGNFTQMNGNSDNFRATNDHRVVLNGTRRQTVNFASTTSRFNILIINKPLSTGYIFSRTPLWNILTENHNLGQAPNAPQNLRASDITVNSMRLEWNTSTDGMAFGYYIYRNGVRIGSTRSNSFIDTGLRINTMYAYHVVAYDMTRNVSNWSNILEVQTADVNTIAPTAPGDFTATFDPNGDAAIRLSWTASAAVVDIDGYNVFRNGVLIGTVGAQSTSFADSTAFPGLHTYHVRAFDIDGNVSAPSRNVTIDNMPPTAPVLSLQQYHETSVILYWLGDEDNVGVTAYHVYQNNVRVAIVTTNVFSSNSLMLNTDYEFYVIALDAAGNASERSNIITLTTSPDTVPPVVTRITPSASDRANVIPLTVTATDNMGVESVQLQYSRDRVNWIDITTLQAGGRTSVVLSHNFIIRELADGSIFVRAVARDINNNMSCLTNTPIVEYRIDHTPPAPPSNLIADTESGVIELIWDEPVDNDVSHFRIFKSTGTDTNFRIVWNNHRNLNFFDADIDINTDYYYYVTAVDRAGNESLRSNTVHARIEDNNVKPIINNMSPWSGTNISSRQQIHISCFNSIQLAGLTVEISLEGSDLWEVIHTRTLNSRSENIEFTLDMSEFETGTYLLRTQIVDRDGNESDYFTVTYNYRAPTLLAPRVTATPGEREINLRWQAIDDDSLAGYTIYKRSATDNNFTVLERITGTNFTDRNVTPGRTFFYYVEAVDIHGNAAASSVVSAVPTHANMPPVANAGIDMVVISGARINFNGSSSQNNHFITSYLWCFDDGSTSSLPNPSYSFSQVRPHNVSLTVSDSAGNTSTATITVEVLDANEYQFVEFQFRDSNTKTSIRNTFVKCTVPDIDIDSLLTDNNGIARIPVKIGTHDFSFLINDYLPLRQTVNVSSSTPRQIIELEKKALITGEITVERLSVNEIRNLGIDITAPENQHVFQFDLELLWDRDKSDFSLIVNSRGEIIRTNIDFNFTVADKSTLVFKDIDSSCSAVSGAGVSRSTTYIRAIPSPGPSQPATIVILNISSDISWLKEFFSVSLDIINNASADFPIIDAFAEIKLPAGLSLPQTNGNNVIKQDMGTIEGGTRSSASWVIRGDVRGLYHIEADFFGTLFPFGKEVNANFRTSNPIRIWGGNALRLDLGITVHEDDLGHTAFTLTNISDENIYNLSMNLGVFSEIYNINDLVLIHSDGVVEVIPWSNGSVNLQATQMFNPALRNVDSDTSVLAPGQSIRGYFTFGRNQDEPDPEDDGDNPSGSGTNTRKIPKHSDEVFNVVYVIDTRSIVCYNEFEQIKNELVKAALQIFAYNPNARIYVMEQNTNPSARRSFQINSRGRNYARNIWDVIEVLNEITLKPDNGINNLSYISDAIAYINRNIDTSVPTFVFTAFDQKDVYYRQSDAYIVLDELEGNGISVGVIADIGGYSGGYVFDLLDNTESMHVEVSNSAYSAIIDFIFVDDPGTGDNNGGNNGGGDNNGSNNGDGGDNGGGNNNGGNNGGGNNNGDGDNGENNDPNTPPGGNAPSPNPPGSGGFRGGGGGSGSPNNPTPATETTPSTSTENRQREVLEDIRKNNTGTVYALEAVRFSVGLVAYEDLSEELKILFEGNPTTTDALDLLRFAVGLPSVLDEILNQKPDEDNPPPEPEPIFVTFNWNFGENPLFNRIGVNEDGFVRELPPMPFGFQRKPEHVFVGWSKTHEGVIVDPAQIKATDVSTYYAQWEPTELIPLRIFHRYDKEFRLKFPDAEKRINEYQDIVSSIIFYLFDLPVITTSVRQYTSIADECKTQIPPGGSIEGIDWFYPCSWRCYTVESLKYDLKKEFTYMEPENLLIRLLRTTWTGHEMIETENSIARSTIWTWPTSIVVMAFNCVMQYYDYDNADEMNKLRNRYINTLLHEIAHHIGARDHYCEEEDTNSGRKCFTVDCWKCKQKLPERPKISCIMLDCMDVESIPINDIFCTRCVGHDGRDGTIGAYLEIYFR